MIIQGRITNVYYDRAGSSLAVETPAGTTEIKVDSNQDFNEEGGECLIGDSTYSYTLGPEGTDYDILTISPGLLIDGLEGEAVSTLPLSDVLRASVREDDNQPTSQDLDCEVAHNVAISLLPGERFDDEGEFVTVSDESGTLTVIQIHGQTPTVAGPYLDGYNDTDPTSDGEAPTEAPVITAVPIGIGAVQLRWGRISNPDPVTYRAYASSSSPVSVTEANYVGVTTGDSITVGKLPGDSSLPYDLDTYFVVVPEDADGIGPVSNEAAGRPRMADNESISSEYAYLGKVQAAQIEAGEMFSDFAELDRITTGSADPRIVLDSNGIVGTDPSGAARFRLPTDADLPAEFRGVGEFDAITVRDRLSLRGKDNEFSRSSRVRLSHAVSRPSQGPSVSVVFPSQSVDIDPNWPERGMKKFSNGKWYSYLNAWGAFQIKVRDQDGAGNLVPSANHIPVEDGNGKYPGRNMNVHDFVEHQGRLMVLVTDSGVQDAWWTNTMVLRQYDIDTGALLRTDRVVLTDYAQRKRAMAVGPDNRIWIVSEGQNQTRWRFERLDVVPISGASVTLNADVSELADQGYDEDLTSLQWVPTTSLVPNGTGGRWVVQRTGHECVFVFTSGTYLRQNNDEFQAPNGTGNKSVWWDGTQWHAWNMARIWHLSDYRWSGSYASTQLWAAKFSWFDSKTTGTGQHESLASPMQTFSMRKFAHIQVTTPPIPAPDEAEPDDSVTGVRLYFRAATVGDFRRGSTDLPDGVNSVVYRTLDTSGPVADSGTLPQFPLSTPAEVYSEKEDSAGPLITLKGDGSGRAGPYRWGSDGRLPGMAVRKTNGQTFTSGQTTTVAFNSVLHQAGGMELVDGTIAVPVSGWYSVSGCLTFAASTSGARRLLLLGVGSTAGVFQNYYGSNAVASAQATSHFTTLTVSGLVYAQAGQYIGLAANTGANWALEYDQSYKNNLQAVYVGG